MAKKSDPVPETTDTYSRLLEVAARHFADDGYKGASQRAIQREAGVNPAAAHYYFGSKEALYRAVVHSFIAGVQEERTTRLSSVPDTLTGRDRLKRLLKDYFEPSIAITSSPAGQAYARILARAQLEGTNGPFDIFEAAAKPVRSLYVNALVRLFPQADPALVRIALLMGVSLMASTAASRARSADESASDVAGRLADFAAAGIEALCGAAGEKV